MSRRDGFRCWRLVAKRRMGTHGIVVTPPALDKDFGFPKIVEQLHIQALIP